MLLVTLDLSKMCSSRVLMTGCQVLLLFNESVNGYQVSITGSQVSDIMGKTMLTNSI